MACTVAVEEVIGEHYNDQIRSLLEGGYREEELLALLKKNRDEELEHLDTGLEQGAEQVNVNGQFTVHSMRVLTRSFPSIRLPFTMLCLMSSKWDVELPFGWQSVYDTIVAKRIGVPIVFKSMTCTHLIALALHLVVLLRLGERWMLHCHCIHVAPSQSTSRALVTRS